MADPDGNYYCGCMTLEPPVELDVVDHIQQTRDSYAQLGYDSYRWAHEPEPAALAKATKSLSESKVALIASGGVYQVGQVAFHHKDDTGYRPIPTDTDVADLRTSHFAYDMTNARVDPNVVFPLDALRSMVDSGTIGSLTSHALTFMGGIYSQRRLNEHLIPAITEEIVAMEPDVVLLVPV
jgi:D-proline reductase (dithiol) PrdB